MEPVTDDARSWKLMGDGGIGRRRVPGTALGVSIAGFFDQIARFFRGQWPQVRPSHHTTINRVAATATPTDINISAFWLTFKATSSRQMKEASETKTLLHSRRGLMSRGLGQLLVGASDVARTENRCHGHRQNCSSELFLVPASICLPALNPMWAIAAHNSLRHAAATGRLSRPGDDSALSLLTARRCSPYQITLTPGI